MRKRTLALALALTTLAAPLCAQSEVQPVAAPAQSPAGLESARKLLAIMKVDRTIGLMFERLVPLMAQATIGSLESEPGTAAMMKSMEAKPGNRERLLAIFSEEFATELAQATPALVERTAKEYANVFSPKELDELVAFYTSGTGEKMIMVMPDLQQKLSIFGQTTGREVGARAGERAMQRAFGELMPQGEKAPKS